MRLYIPIAVAALFASAAVAQSVPSAIFTDPPADTAHPAAMAVLHIPSHGVNINGLIYQPSGAGPHPTLVLCHGLPGNEKNLDVAQAVRRAGWNAVTFNYRGSWGSPGKFRFAQNIEDAEAVLAYLRNPANAGKLGVDTQRIVIAGHSMGGWVVANVASRDRNLYAAILICPADMASEADMPRDAQAKEMADNMEALAGVTPQSMVADINSLPKTLRFPSNAAGLARLPILVLTADDGLAPAADALVHSIQSHTGSKVASMHVATDHSWSDKRIALESIVINWLAALDRSAAASAQTLH
jgi:uncharacterized protein